MKNENLYILDFECEVHVIWVLWTRAFKNVFVGLGGQRCWASFEEPLSPRVAPLLHNLELFKRDFSTKPIETP
jgi:hypothetical protein